MKKGSPEDLKEKANWQCRHGTKMIQNINILSRRECLRETAGGCEPIGYAICSSNFVILFHCMETLREEGWVNAALPTFFLINWSTSEEGK